MTASFGPMVDGLPAWSGATTKCVKCARLNGPTSTWHYDAVTGDDYMERRCFLCGYRWHEKCADTGAIDG